MHRMSIGRMDKISNSVFVTEDVWFRSRDGPPYGEPWRGKH